MERLHTERGKAAFTLKERIQKHRMTHSNNTVVSEEDANVDDVEDDIETFRVLFISPVYKPVFKGVGRNALFIII
jgi:hypothetical protein